MDVREKLVELIGSTEYGNGSLVGKNFQKGFIEKIASNLIANGVTVQECGHWISLTECANAGVYCSVCHKKVYKEDYAWCNRKNKLHNLPCKPFCGTQNNKPPRLRNLSKISNVHTPAPLRHCQADNPQPPRWGQPVRAEISASAKSPLTFP